MTPVAAFVRTRYRSRVLTNAATGLLCLSVSLALTASEPPSGLFMTADDKTRIQNLVAKKDSSYAELYAGLLRRADAALGKEASPFRMQDVTQIEFGWCKKPSPPDDTLKDLTSKLEKQSDWIRTLALAFSLSGKPRYAKHAEKLLLAWARDSTLLNLYDLDIDFRGGGFAGMTTDGYCGSRPWNMALDAMWQTYGLINVSDAYILLRQGGHAFDRVDEAVVRVWIRALAEAVNSSFHAWTRWADAHKGSRAYTRYRADNHLSWCLAGLLAAAAALDDEDLAAYVLEGEVWEDSKAGRYANPSSIRAVIDIAIEADAEGKNAGRIYEEKIRRDPPVGYAMFHLWPMALVASIAEKHYGDDVWSFKGADGAGLREAYRRYAAYALGEWDSPRPDQEGSRRGRSWIFELAANVWPEETKIQEALAAGKRGKHVVQSGGPLTLLYGKP